jgi:hypothetical protein
MGPTSVRRQKGWVQLGMHKGVLAAPSVFQMAGFTALAPIRWEPNPIGSVFQSADLGRVTQQRPPSS